MDEKRHNVSKRRKTSQFSGNGRKTSRAAIRTVPHRRQGFWSPKSKGVFGARRDTPSEPRDRESEPLLLPVIIFNDFSVLPNA